MAAMEGSLSKWTNLMKGWQYRWFVLDDNAGLLSYYTSREKMMRGVRRGCVRLKGAVIGIDDGDDSTFTITVDSKTFHFQARDGDEREKWIRCLEDTITRHAYGYKNPGSLRLDSMRPTVSMQDFDKKLAESDGYLQILINQIKTIELKMETDLEEEEKSKCELIISHTNNLLEQVKHTIVLLQIAKNTAYPVNGTYRPVDKMDSSPTALDDGPPPLASTSLVVSDPAYSLPPGSIAVPETSYSTSEEEDFYDAHDSSDPPSPTAMKHSYSQNMSTSFDAADTEQDDEGDAEGISPLNDNSPPTYVKADGTLDYDALYEDPEETNISMESQGSVVSHLLSQVKIGMDLTKVALPTFILERRSLLEMYADYFAHPDMFVKISDLATERERMVQVVKWYLCSYHAGRKSTVAKKPYNPILGEVFQCFWDIPGEEVDSGENEPIDEGPVPWCTKQQLSFVAEQVSHHPPISAFYAEHYNKQISFNAHVWTKSKFLGLSIGVHNVGCGVINVVKHDEQYAVTFPNGYGRSILTVPWIELGGTVTISCEKTGYRASIDFLTKPFYGGKKHRVLGEVYAPNEKKSFLTVTGEWNGVMQAKWADGKTEQFANVNGLSIIKKNVRPIDVQNENESRKLWKEVTAGLRLNNVPHASDAKYNLEQRQRQEAQQRKDNGLEWETKLFRRDSEDGWLYIHPLAKRIDSYTNR